MNFRYDISKVLSKDHVAIIELLGRLLKFIKDTGITGNADWRSSEIRELFSDLKFAFQVEVPRHFTIEEKEVFPILSENGMEDMVEVLTSEHRVILDLIGKVSPIIVKFVDEGVEPTKGEWEELVRFGGSLITELSSHAEKEEYAFVPAVEETLDDEQARRIIAVFQSM